MTASAPSHLHARFVHINSRFAVLAKSIPETAYDTTASATPDWTVRQLVEHVIANNYAMAASISGIDQPPTADGVPLLPAIHAATEAANQAALIESDLQHVVRNQYGADMTIEDILRMGMADRGLHYWDLAVSLGLPAEDFLNDQDAQTVYDFVMQSVEEMRQIKAFGPEVPVPADASIQARLLGATGRDPARSMPVHVA